jgi:DNA uptake protein ComE-like DNA-binding protein
MNTHSRLCFLVVAGVAVTATGAAAQAGHNTDVLNPNLAGAEELAALPQLNDALVKAIMDGRPFLTMQAFHDAVGSKLSTDDAAALYVGLFVPINLNTASEAEILMVPGVGNRMAHEFDEYRPYRALAQFRREMGKYVDDDEVARMEQYVFVPIDLNTASEEDILSLPGVGNRMAHEFDEYRPWKSLEQFRREIGKYVDDDEVARLERFVVINP